MVLKLVDCVDILKAFHTGIDFIFLFDNACGHDRERKYGLNVMNINSGHGRAQQEMHPTKIKYDFGYLGPHDQIIEIGDEQNMVFQLFVNGPFWMTPQERVATNFIQYYDMQLKDKKKADLLVHIKNSGVGVSEVNGEEGR